MHDASSVSRELRFVKERGDDTTHCDQFEVEYVVVAGDYKVQVINLFISPVWHRS